MNREIAIWQFGLVFDVSTSDSLCAAFDGAWHSFQQSAPLELSPSAAEHVCDVLALRLIRRAQQGESNVTRLREDALEYLAAIMAPRAALPITAPT